MRAQARLLETLVRYWDLDQGVFDLQGEVLEIAAKDIYFITSFSHRGVAIYLSGFIHGGDPLSVQDYMNTYYVPVAQKMGTQVPIG